jgi:hypothetical protein
MRKHPSRFAERITAALADHGVLGFNGLMVATAAPNNQILSRNLRPAAPRWPYQPDRFADDAAHHAVSTL